MLWENTVLEHSPAAKSASGSFEVKKRSKCMEFSPFYNKISLVSVFGLAFSCPPATDNWRAERPFHGPRQLGILPAFSEQPT